jgi:hypothetical protein
LILFDHCFRAECSVHTYRRGTVCA